MEETLGDPQRVTPELVEEVLEKTKQLMSKPILDQVDRLSDELGVAKGQVEGVSSELAETRQTLEDALYELTALKRQEASQLEWIRIRSIAIGRIARDLIYLILVVVAMTGAWLCLPSWIPFGQEGIPLSLRLPLGLLVVVAVLIGLAFHFTKWKPNVIAHKFEVLVSQKVSALYLRRYQAQR